jgi:hypothetical protein
MKVVRIKNFLVKGSVLIFLMLYNRHFLLPAFITAIFWWIAMAFYQQLNLGYNISDDKIIMNDESGIT